MKYCGHCGQPMLAQTRTTSKGDYDRVTGLHPRQETIYFWVCPSRMNPTDILEMIWQPSQGAAFEC